MRNLSVTEGGSRRRLLAIILAFATAVMLLLGAAYTQAAWAQPSDDQYEDDEYTSDEYTSDEYTTSEEDGPCAGAAEQLGMPDESYLSYISDVGGCVSFEGTDIIGSLSATVYDSDTGAELGILKDLDSDLTSGDFSVTYEEFCGAFPSPFAGTAQEYYDQQANFQEQAILDPEGDGAACAYGEDTNFSEDTDFSEDTNFSEDTDFSEDTGPTSGEEDPQCIDGIPDLDGDGQISATEAAQAGANATQGEDPCSTSDEGEETAPEGGGGAGGGGGSGGDGGSGGGGGSGGDGGSGGGWWWWVYLPPDYDPPPSIIYRPIDFTTYIINNPWTFVGHCGLVASRTYRDIPQGRLPDTGGGWVVLLLSGAALLGGGWSLVRLARRFSG